MFVAGVTQGLSLTLDETFTAFAAESPAYDFGQRTENSPLKLYILYAVCNYPCEFSVHRCIYYILYYIIYIHYPKHAYK